MLLLLMLNVANYWFFIHFQVRGGTWTKVSKIDKDGRRRRSNNCRSRILLIYY